MSVKALPPIWRLLLALVAFVLVELANLGLWPGLHDGGAANAAELVDTIAAKRAALNLSQRGVDLPTEKGREVRSAIKRGDYATAQKIFREVLASSRLELWRFYPFTDFVEAIADLDDPAFKTGLYGWVSRGGNDAAPLLIRALYNFDVAWAKRGHDYSFKTSAASMDAFLIQTQRALDDAGAAIRLDGANPFSFYLRLDILRGAASRQTLLQAFQEGIEKYPAYYPLYDVMLNALQPKWGGDVESMNAFVDLYAGGAPENSPLKLLYVALYRYFLETATTACGFSYQDPDNLAACVASTMSDISKPELKSALAAALALYDHLDKYQFGVAVEAIVTDALKLYGGAPFAGVLLEMAATAMHSNTQLKPGGPVSNNYVIDTLAALSWYWKGHYPNTLQKTREALHDVEATDFPGEAERSLAIAEILEYAGGAYGKLGQFEDTVANLETAVSLGDAVDWQQYICYGYYQLKEYDAAIRSCTSAIDNSARAMEARYWRGSVYRDAGDVDAALKDLAIVANSESDLRASAAIGMSMIYFGRNDDHGALDVLNRYDYLYDPEKTRKDDVAVSYNNRCYAYMQLGELRKALDDCNASLKFGSIPDAYSKQAELMKRLNIPG